MKCYNYKKRNKNIEIRKKSRIEIILIIITIILSISQIFGLIYPIFSNLYSSVDKFLRKINMVLITLTLLLLIICISFFVIRLILEYLYLKKDKFLNTSFNKFFLKNILFVVIVFLFLLHVAMSFSLYFFYKISIYDICLAIMILIPSVLCIFAYEYIKIKEKYRRCKYNLFNRSIKFIASSKLLLFSIIFYAFIINTMLCEKNYTLPNEFYNLENKLSIEEKIKNDDEIKNRLIIEKLLDKIGIDITYEEIENEKNKLIEKYSNNNKEINSMLSEDGHIRKDINYIKNSIKEEQYKKECLSQKELDINKTIEHINTFNKNYTDLKLELQELKIENKLLNKKIEDLQEENTQLKNNLDKFLTEKFSINEKIREKQNQLKNKDLSIRQNQKNNNRKH